MSPDPSLVVWLYLLDGASDVIGAAKTYFEEVDLGTPYGLMRDVGIVFGSFCLANIYAQCLYSGGAVLAYCDNTNVSVDAAPIEPVRTQPQMSQDDVRALWQSRMQDL